MYEIEINRLLQGDSSILFNEIQQQFFTKIVNEVDN